MMEANKTISGKACLLIYERGVWLFCLLQDLVEDGKNRAYDCLACVGQKVKLVHASFQGIGTIRDRVLDIPRNLCQQ